MGILRARHLEDDEHPLAGAERIRPDVLVPAEDSAYSCKPIPYHFSLSQVEEGFVRWYLAETRNATEGPIPATHWLWSNGVYPSILVAFLARLPTI